MAYYGQSPFCPFIMWFVLWPLLASPSGWPSTFIGILPASSHLLGRSSSSIPLDPLHMITSPFSSARPAYNLLSCPHSPFSLSSYRGWKCLVSLSSLGAPEPYSWCQDLPNVGYMKFLRWASVDHIWLWCSVVLMWFTPLIVYIPKPHSTCIQMVCTRRSQGCQ